MVMYCACARLFHVSSGCVSFQGQLGHGEDRTHASGPLLVNPSALKNVTRIDAGDSYSAALAGEHHPERSPDQGSVSERGLLSCRTRSNKLILDPVFVDRVSIEHSLSLSLSLSSSISRLVNSI